jgi:ketosteroid isomerase-like protein
VKTRSILAVAGLFAFGATALPVRADDAAVRKQLNGQYAKLAAAFKSKNANAVMALGTPDFSMKERNGVVSDAKASTEGIKQMFAMVKSFNRVDMKIHKLAVKGNQAVATTTYVYDSQTPPDPKGKSHRMVSKGLTKDTWVKAGSTWKVRSVEMLKDEMTMDGKKIDPAMMAPPQTLSTPKRK